MIFLENYFWNLETPVFIFYVFITEIYLTNIWRDNWRSVFDIVKGNRYYFYMHVHFQGIFWSLIIFINWQILVLQQNHQLILVAPKLLQILEPKLQLDQ